MADKQPETPAPRQKLEAHIKSADMAEEMQQESIDIAQEAMSKFTIEKDIAQHIKRTVRTIHLPTRRASRLAIHMSTCELDQVPE
ncbi:hypothetical protein E4U17_006191 [Claviceps sp. LM77 group G4]|nr:hypothetical protein E4U17_006191 [Claviceps sp. LM77 group G4]KAG6063484.1 hypothetical protein E4U33_006340 [Claviceps sp. LM78 group G4]KAG6071057.1 hypothetical protein E4U16_006403 [Claviceps sp. LM84 group G4]